MSIFYRPAGAWAGDFIPFYENGRFHLFYLHDWRDRAGHGEGVPWYQITTTDFVHFAEHGQMLARGSESEQDLYVFTGSVLAAPDGYHIFYTGNNPHLRAQGQPEQGVMHAVSTDLLHWRKLPEHTFFAPAGYEPHDWRDPYVFWNEEAGEYWMLLAARLTDGPSRRRGCTALCASLDLQHWQGRPPFYAPGLYFTHECPDLFRLGDWWYLLFSEFSERTVTRYRMARSLAGPWLAPTDDTFDGRAFYAAKTATDGGQRYLFGWLATREGERDRGAWQWGGDLVVHALVPRPDGSLAVRPPESLAEAFDPPQAVPLLPGLGDCGASGDAAELSAPGTFATVLAGSLPGACRLHAHLEWQAGTRACGLVLRASADQEQGYYVRLEPDRSRLVLDMWPRPGDVPYMIELERPLPGSLGSALDIDIIIDRTVCEVYTSCGVTLSTRLYDLPAGGWGFFVQDGGLRVSEVALSAAGQPAPGAI
jgi:beta-fructofuranosidase